MLGPGIKNGILFLLIIMILHFLIKNIQLEKYSNMSQVEDQKACDAKVKDAVESANIPDTPVTKELLVSHEDKKKELYKYVMESSDMEKIAVPQANDDDFKNNYNLACDAKSIMNKPEDFTKVQLKPRSDEGPFLTIHEYKDESSLNGGVVFDGINGYDGLGSMYQSYSCLGK
jgi:hypothetical protein